MKPIAKFLGLPSDRTCNNSRRPHGKQDWGRHCPQVGCPFEDEDDDAIDPLSYMARDSCRSCRTYPDTIYLPPIMVQNSKDPLHHLLMDVTIGVHDPVPKGPKCLDARIMLFVAQFDPTIAQNEKNPTPISKVAQNRLLYQNRKIIYMRLDKEPIVRRCMIPIKCRSI